MVKPDHLNLDCLMSRKGYTGEVRTANTRQQHATTAATQQLQLQPGNCTCTQHAITMAVLGRPPAATGSIPCACGAVSFWISSSRGGAISWSMR